MTYLDNAGWTPWRRTFAVLPRWLDDGSFVWFRMFDMRERIIGGVGGTFTEAVETRRGGAR